MLSPQLRFGISIAKHWYNGIVTRRKKESAKRSDAECLRLFLDVVDEVLSRRAVRNGLKASWEWEWDETNNDIRFFCNRSDEDDLRSLAIDLRKFTSKGEDVCLSHIFNALWQESASTRIQEQSAALRKEWKTAQVDTQYPHGRDKKRAQYTPIDSWDLWVDGGVFH